MMQQRTTQSSWTGQAATPLKHSKLLLGAAASILCLTPALLSIVIGAEYKWTLFWAIYSAAAAVSIAVLWRGAQAATQAGGKTAGTSGLPAEVAPMPKPLRIPKPKEWGGKGGARMLQSLIEMGMTFRVYAYNDVALCDFISAKDQVVIARISPGKDGWGYVVGIHNIGHMNADRFDDACAIVLKNLLIKESASE